MVFDLKNSKSRAEFISADSASQITALLKAKPTDVQALLREHPNALRDVYQQFERHFSSELGKQVLVASIVSSEYKAFPSKWNAKEQLTKDDENRLDNFKRLSSSGQMLYMLQNPDLPTHKALKEAARFYNVDAQGIALAALSEGHANIGTAKAFARNISFNPAGYGTVHEKAIKSMRPNWSDAQIDNSKLLPETALPLIAQDMEIKAVIYEKIAGINIRNNPAVLAWAYNTSVSNILNSAIKQAEIISKGGTPNLDISLNTGLYGVGMAKMADGIGVLPEVRGLKKLNASEHLKGSVQNEVAFNVTLNGERLVPQQIANEIKNVSQKIRLRSGDIFDLTERSLPLAHVHSKGEELKIQLSRYLAEGMRIKHLGEGTKEGVYDRTKDDFKSSFEASNKNNILVKKHVEEFLKQYKNPQEASDRELLKFLVDKAHHEGIYVKPNQLAFDQNPKITHLDSGAYERLNKNIDILFEQNRKLTDHTPRFSQNTDLPMSTPQPELNQALSQGKPLDHQAMWQPFLNIVATNDIEQKKTV